LRAVLLYSDIEAEVRTEKHYSGVLRLSVLLAAAMLICLGGCYPDDDVYTKPSSSPGPGVQTAPAAVDASITAAIERLRSGDFSGAQAVLDAEPPVARADSLRLLLSRHERLEAHRIEERQKAYDEQIAELRKIEAKASGSDVFDVNTVDDAMVAAIRAREYAAEENKNALFDDPFVQRVIAAMRSRGETYLEEGKWVDAYAHCYYWLTNLYEVDKTYKATAERLTELASIELSLKDSGCGESAAERHEGIQPEMLLRALNALETNYVNGIDYSKMIEKALLRCDLLGEALHKSADELVWKADTEAVQRWTTGIGAIRTEIQSTGGVALRAEHLVRVFDEVLTLNAVTLKLPQEVAVAHFSEASLESLDPFTTLVWPWSVKDFEKSMTQQFTGIGVEISKRTGALKILSLLPDTPAYKTGLDADDEILAVNGESTADMTIFCAVSKITGPKGTKVTLTMRRPATGHTWDVTIVRDKIVVQPLRGWRRTEEGAWDYMIDPSNGVGYVRLTAFTETSGPDLHKTLLELEKKGLAALILDLRFNSGGYLSSAAEVVDLFVQEGVIVKSNPRHGLATYEIARRSGTHPNYPLVILINGASASASEIVAGALQDPQHQRAILVGERSYGKGSVQVVTPFTGGGSQLKYTIAYYHLPSDQQVKNRYQMEREGRKDWGIAPDVEVKMFSNEMRTMLDMQRDNDVLFRAGHAQDGETPLRHSLEMTLQSDPQLAVALAIAQSKLIAAGKTVTLAPLEILEPAVTRND
jgi:C-terminal peptidase prc